MKSDLILEFSKMNGAGNDFVVIDNRFFAFSGPELSTLAQTLCPRRTSVGSDGILALDMSQLDQEADFRMIHYNADGSRGTMCGNGARCLVRFAADSGLVPTGSCTFDTDAGRYRATVLRDDNVRLFVPQAKYQRQTSIVDEAMLRPVEYIWTGTEHAVCFVSEVDSFPVEKRGPELRAHPEFGEQGANVNFVEVLDRRGTIAVRTFEKGVEAETLACGTGSIASAIVSYRAGWVTQKRITVRMPGGTLTVGFEDSGNLEPREIYLEGPAVTVYRGSLPIDV